MSNDRAASEGEIYLEVDCSGEDADGEGLSHVLSSISTTLHEAPENKRYDFEISIDERDIEEDND